MTRLAVALTNYLVVFASNEPPRPTSQTPAS